MKNLLYILSLVMLASCQGQAQPTVLGEANLYVESDVHDFGTIQKGGDGTCVFIIKNTGSEPLIISKCDKTCGCTIPECSTQPVTSGQTTEVKVTYDTKRVGPFNKSVKVHSNDPDEPVKVLRITGEVVES